LVLHIRFPFIGSLIKKYAPGRVILKSSMRLDWTIPCMGVSLENAVITRLEGAGWDELHVEGLPAEIEFIVLARLLGQPEEYAEEGHTMEANLTGPGMEGVANVVFDLPTSEPGPDHPEGWEMNALIPIVLQFTANSEGTYMVDLYINGRYQQGRSIPFRIRAAAAS
jgi:hypothetical protein